MKLFSKGVFFVVLAFFTFQTSFGQGRYFRWFDQKLNARIRLDVSVGQLEMEALPGNWKPFGELIQLDSGMLTQLPPTLSNHYFFSADKQLVTLPVAGTGQVYELDFATNRLKRIDRTFYSGYNFGAEVFERNGVIYSVGGVGFWAYSKAITYFDTKSAEWQAIRPKNPGPKSIFNGYQGYSNSADKFFTGGSEEGEFLENVPLGLNKNLYGFDFKTNTWEELGEINPLLLQDVPRELAWNGQYFIQFSREKVYLIDPVKNEVFEHKSTQEQFQGGEYRFVAGDTVYCYWDLENGSGSKFSIPEIQSKASYIGSFYNPPSSFLMYYLLGGGAVVLFLGILMYRSKSKKESQIQFDEQEKVLLKSLVSLSPGCHLSTVEVNELLGLSTKTLENQRRIRLNTISQLNQKIQLFYQIDQGVERHASPDDKRQSRYSLSPEAYKRLKEYF